ncbi:MAG: outer membrane lipoprotein-sorting protein [Deltaproteobacteria bacterium]|nr:outer membrane lipoprotein-sorting protein [Deltaproteobacteria bacterium]
MKRIIVLSVIAFFPLTAWSSELSGLEVVKRWDERDEGKDLTSKSTFKLINSKGQERIRKTRRYWINMKEKGGFEEKSIIFFDRPSDVKGTSLLNWSYQDAGKDDDQWLYLPALRKIKRIAASDKEKSFMGSDLTFDDMGDRKVESDEHKLLREEALDGRPCYVVEMTPGNKKYMYSRKEKWIDKETFVDYRTDFYDRKGRFLKRQRIDWKKIGNVWVVTKIYVKNEQTGHSTSIEIEDIKLNTGLKEGWFTKRKMESGR